MFFPFSNHFVLRGLTFTAKRRLFTSFLSSSPSLRRLSGFTTTRHVSNTNHVTGTTDHVTGLDFSDTSVSYGGKSFRELLQAAFVYQLFSFTTIVDSSEKILKFTKRIFGRRLFRKLMKYSIYGQFIAGEDLTTLRPAMKRLRESGVYSILDYAVEDDVQSKESVYMEVRQTAKPESGDLPVPTDEDLHPQFLSSATPGAATVRSSARTYFYHDEHKCDENMENFIKCIKVAADASEGEDAFAAIKLTGLGRTEFLLRLSEALVGSQKVFLSLADSSDLLNGRITSDSFMRGAERMKIDVNQLPRLFEDLGTGTDKTNQSIDFLQWSNIFQPGKELYRILSNKKFSPAQPRLPIMSEKEKAQMKSVMRRMETLADVAQERGVRLMVDAEQTYYQPAIRHITVHRLMPKYNLTTPIIYNTQQCYLKNADLSVKLDLWVSGVNGVHYGVKLVRGAYMEQERTLADNKNYESPVWDTKSESDHSYHKILNHLMERMKDNRVKVMVATHNESSIRYALERMAALGIGRESIAFGQLLGMCDHVTFALGASGYRVYKYAPYGPVEDAIPYLLRRANENKGMLEGARRERELLRKELKRRLTWRKTV